MTIQFSTIEQSFTNALNVSVLHGHPSEVHCSWLASLSLDVAGREVTRTSSGCIPDMRCSKELNNVYITYILRSCWPDISAA